MLEAASEMTVSLAVPQQAKRLRIAVLRRRRNQAIVHLDFCRGRSPLKKNLVVPPFIFLPFVTAPARIARALALVHLGQRQPLAA
jgi:hypothetical protein